MTYAKSKLHQNIGVNVKYTHKIVPRLFGWIAFFSKHYDYNYDIIKDKYKANYKYCDYNFLILIR